MVFHLISVSPGSGNDARGFPQGQVARDHVGRQPSDVGELFDGAEAQLALRVRVVGLGDKTGREKGREVLLAVRFKFKLKISFLAFTQSAINVSSSCLTLSPTTPDRSLWERHVNLPRLERRFRVWTGRKGNNHSRHLGNLLLGASGRRATVQTAPAPLHLLQGRSSPAAPRPRPLPRLPEELPCRAGMATPPPSTGRHCHQHPQPGAPSQPAILIIFSHEISQWLFSLLSGQRPKSTARLPRHCLDPPTPPSRASSSATCPPLSVPATLALTPSFLSCPFAPSLLSNHLRAQPPKSYHLGSLICPRR